MSFHSLPGFEDHHPLHIEIQDGVFVPIRATPEIQTCEWVIERCSGPEHEWHEIARIPGQLESDFEDLG